MIQRDTCDYRMNIALHYYLVTLQILNYRN